MTQKAASEVILGGLHSKVAKIMTNALDAIEVAQERYLAGDDNEEEMPVVSAPLLGVITKFLSDNKINCVPEESQELSALERRLAAKNKVHTIGNVVHLNE